MSKCKNIIWKTLKIINVCITNFFVSCGILVMLMLLYSNNVKLDDLSLVAIFNFFIMYSSVYMVVYICKKLFFNNKYVIQTSSSDITEKEYPSEQKVKENACIHEAGHAVVSILLGIKIESVEPYKTITKTIYYPLLDEEYLRKIIIISYAGPATEKILLNRISMGCIGNDDADFILAERQIKDMLLISKDYSGYVACGEQFYVTVNKISTELFNKAEEMVDKNRNLIYMVADELLRKEKLSENEVKQIIGNVK